jgi:hypothetical protein
VLTATLILPDDGALEEPKAVAWEKLYEFKILSTKK